MNITLTIYVDAAEAAKLGRSVAGPTKYHLSADEAKLFTDAQRDTLSRHCSDRGGHKDGLKHWGDPLTRHAPKVGEATRDVIAMLLDTRRREMLEQISQRLDCVGPFALLVACEDAHQWIGVLRRGAYDALRDQGLVRTLAEELGSQHEDLKSFAAITLLGRDLLAFERTKANVGS